MRVLVVSGGTGGHLFPALELACELKSRNIAEILFITTSRMQDRNLVEARHMDYRTLPVIPLKSKNIISILDFFVRLIAAFIRSIFTLLKYRPLVLIGFGGYVAGPIALTASLLGVKTIIHEQNVYPGKANRILAGFVDRIAISFPETISYFKKHSHKIVYSGNPVRHGLCRLGKSGDNFTVLVMGGSQGSHRLNEIVPKAFGLLDIEPKKNISIIHIAGDKECDAVKDVYRHIDVKNRVFSFTQDMDKIYNECDFVISRSGAMTISELLELCMPSILIPYPYAGGHQRYNAKVLTDIGAAILVEEKFLDPPTLKDAIMKLMDRNVLNDMSRRIKNINRPNATEVLIREITLYDKR